MLILSLALSPVQEHRLAYNRGQPDESFEWAALSELEDSELREAAPPSGVELPPGDNAGGEADRADGLADAKVPPVADASAGFAAVAE